MCRLRIPNGVLQPHQMIGLADLAERWGGGSADITTRANLQIREIKPHGIVEMLEGLQDLGLTSRGAGADNIRNITGSPTAGIDRQELIDTRPLARELHHYILNHRELYGLPRKFNIAFDGGGAVSVLEDTNDIGFAAVKVAAGAAVPEGIYFRMGLGGITGHDDFARDTGILLKPEECLAAAVAVLRVFIAEGDRTDRKRARMKYALDRLGHDKFMAAVEKEHGKPFTRLPLTDCVPRIPAAKHGHIGVHAQRQEGLSYVGVSVPVGRLSAAQMKGLGALASRFAGATLRLTVWQNLILSHVPNDRIGEVDAALVALGLGAATSAIRGALVACTGNTGCKFAATNTKAQALQLADHLEQRVALDRPVSIHLTGCPHSCAQHKVSDIGLLGVKVGDDMIEGYSILVGGGAGPEQKIGREVFPAVPMADMPERVEALLRAYLARRAADESFHDFATRHSVDELKALAMPQPEMAA
jgi:ferredoxin-nitrite reductase